MANDICARLDICVLSQINRTVVKVPIKLILLRTNQNNRWNSKNPKDHISCYDNQGVVYSTPRGDCNLKYIGQTKKPFDQRKRIHELCYELPSSKSALAKHAVQLKLDIE